MEFKGTKGPWSTNTHCVFSGDEELIGKNVICRLHTGLIRYMGVDQKANSLLISKAPEMLEILKDLVSCSEYGYISAYEGGYEDWEAGFAEKLSKAKNLINEATNV